MSTSNLSCEVCVVGGGASGMFSAIFAARNGAKVTIIESNPELGKKLYATGNGKCNLLNLDQSVTHFHGEDEYFIRDVLSEISIDQLLGFFREMGIMTFERDGYLYPRSEQAASVVNALTEELKRLKVNVVLNEKLRKLNKLPGGNFELLTRSGRTIYAMNVILCTGGSAAPKTGSDGSGYYYAKQFGHNIIQPLPALVQLCMDHPVTKKWAGVRLKGTAAMIINDWKVAEEYGELMLTDYGLSGIPVFQISYLASKALFEKNKVVVELDLIREYSEDELVEYWMGLHKTYPNLDFVSLNNGLLPEKLLKALSDTNIIKNATLTPEFFWKMASVIKHLRFSIVDTKGFEQAQVSAGGISTRDIDCATMQSKRTRGLYFAGEVLDYNGDCGGYNLQWAWVTGYLAGCAAAKKGTRR